VARRLLRRSSLVNVAIPVTVLFSRLENHRFFYDGVFNFFSTQIRFIFIRSFSALTFFLLVYCVRPRSLEASNPPLSTYHKIKNPSKYKNNDEILIQIRNIELIYFCVKLQINVISNRRKTSMYT